MTTVSSFLMGTEPLNEDQERKVLSSPKIGKIAAAVRALSAATGGLPFVGDLVSQIRKALERPVTDGVIQAWKKRSELLEFTDTAKHPPEEQITYTIGEFSVESVYEPSLKLSVNGVEEWTIAVEAEIALDVDAGDLLIQGGRIWELRLGTATARGTLRVEGQEVAKRESEPIALPGTVRFENGIPIAAALGA